MTDPSLELGGIGTSPVWEDVVKMAGDGFKITVDSSGVGPSDHTSFITWVYRYCFSLQARTKTT